MSFQHRFKNIDEEAFLFHFKHQNIGAIDDFIHMWQANERSLDTPLEDLKLNLILNLSMMIRLMIKEGYSSEILYSKTEFIISIIRNFDSISEFQLFEKKIIHEYFQLFILKHRKTDSLVVNHILNYLYVHLNQVISLDALAREIKVSKSHCVRVFNDIMGSTIIQYHTMLKMERADFFLTSTKDSLSTIALNLGYHDQSHFTKTFKRLRGLTPKQYRTKHNV